MDDFKSFLDDKRKQTRKQKPTQIHETRKVETPKSALPKKEHISTQI